MCTKPDSPACLCDSRRCTSTAFLRGNRRWGCTVHPRTKLTMRGKAPSFKRSDTCPRNKASVFVRQAMLSATARRQHNQSVKRRHLEHTLKEKTESALSIHRKAANHTVDCEGIAGGSWKPREIELPRTLKQDKGAVHPHSPWDVVLSLSGKQ